MLSKKKKGVEKYSTLIIAKIDKFQDRFILLITKNRIIVDIGQKI